MQPPETYKTNIKILDDRGLHPDKGDGRKQHGAVSILQLIIAINYKVRNKRVNIVSMGVI